MAASRPLTNVLGYSAAKAAVANLTSWLAIELARQGEAGTGKADKAPSLAKPGEAPC